MASLGPDAADLPVKKVFEAVTPLPIAKQVDALDNFHYTLFRNEVIRTGDTAGALLSRLGITDPEAVDFVRRNPEARTALLSKSGRAVTAEATQENKLVRLATRWVANKNGSFQRFVVERHDAGFAGRTETHNMAPTLRLASGVVRNTLFSATDDANVPDTVASQLVDIFSGDVDFRSLSKDARFAVAYESFEADGQPLRAGRVLSAEFESNGKVHQAMWFQEPGRKGGYYRLNGDSLQRAYLRSPVQYSRVSSGFAMRMHPIFNDRRQHNGVDFAAVTGTPVRTIGDGKVEFAGWQKGYGNVVTISHRNKESTVYAHLSRIDVKQGQSVTQGQFIGAVGATGWATGPHLHFEFRIKGESHDPMAYLQQEGSATTVAAASRPAFDRQALAARTELASALSVVEARNTK